MNALRRFWRRLAASASRRQDDRRWREEIDEHLALQTADYVRAGMTPGEARRQALLRFGPAAALHEQYRDEQRLPLVEHFLQDATYALRQLRKAPLFTLTAVLSLALGIGANTAVLTVIQRVLTPLPVSHPEDLVFVTEHRSQEDTSPRFSYPFYSDLRNNTVLAGTAARYSLALSAAIDGSVSSVNGELVSGNYFEVLGAATQIGRPFTAADDRIPGAHAVAVISDGFWRRSFASDPSVLGRVIRVNESPFVIVGVAARGFTGTDLGTPADVWVP